MIVRGLMAACVFLSPVFAGSPASSQNRFRFSQRRRVQEIRVCILLCPGFRLVGRRWLM